MDKKSDRKEGRHDIWWGKDGTRRLERLAAASGKSYGEIARTAIADYELSQSFFRDEVCRAVLNLLQTQVDGQSDPADDEREVQAVRALGALLGSGYAAEGIQQAFKLLFAQNMHILPELRIPVFPEDETAP